MNAPNYRDRPDDGPSTAISRTVWAEAITAAAWAPSVHNTQPWRFVVRPDVAELHLDPGRLLPVADPTGREARISCGAALFNLHTALRAAGSDVAVGLMPRRSHPTLLAMVRPFGRRAPNPTELSLHAAIPRRRSHRRPFHPAPVAPAALHQLVYAAAVEGGYLRLAQDPPTVSAITALIRRAQHLQQHDRAYRRELAGWTFGSGDEGDRTDGVPHHASGPRSSPDSILAMRDFAPECERPARAYESDPLLGVLLSAGDTPLDQLRAGQALQHALLVATTRGVGASILSAPTELPLARASLHRLVGGSMWPQLVLRFGSAVPTPASPRRPVTEFADFHDFVDSCPGGAGPAS
jgi:nitroreductase